jgi:hypothetical protein
MTKRQHYVPQSNLKLFSHDEKLIYVLNKTDGSVRLQNIKDTAVINHFYRDKKHPAPMEIPEITALENDTYLVIKKIELQERITSSELGQLCNYISLQFLRVPKSKERSEKMFFLFWNELRKRYIEKKTLPQKLIEEIAADFLKEDVNSPKVKKFLTSNTTIATPGTLFMDTIVAQGHSIAELLSKQKWTFHFTQKREEWLTSDNPVSVSDSFEEDEIYHPILNGKTIKFIPLSRKVMLSVTGDNFSVESKTMFRWAVRDLNLLTALNASKYVYSGNERLLQEIKTMIVEYKKNPVSYRKYLISTRSELI